MDLLKRIIGIVLIAAVLTVVIFGVVGFIKSKVSPKAASVTQTNTVSATPSAQTNISVSPEPIPQTGESKKNVNSVGVNFSFPNNWGVLSCSNSSNFELDPSNSSDSRIVCDIAQKPITVLVNSNLVCKGQPTNISGMNVLKYRVENARGVDYQWCFSKNGVNYNITHRVSPTAVRGTSTDDYSAKVEEMIGSVK